MIVGVCFSFTAYVVLSHNNNIMFITIELIGRLEEDSAQLSHDLEDSCMFPSDATITSAKDFVACVNKHIKGMCVFKSNDLFIHMYMCMF